MKEIKERMYSLLENKWGEIFIVSSLVLFISFIYKEILQYKYTGPDFFAILAGSADITEAVASPVASGFLGATWYRPFRGLTLHFDYLINDLDPFGYQLTNLILFIIAVVLVYLLVRQIFANKKIAFMSSLIFAFYPITMNVIPVVQRRSEILMAIFLILTILFLDRYLKTDNKIWQIFGGITSFLAFCSKDPAIVIVPLLVVFYIIVKKKNQELNLKELIYSFLPFAVSFVVFYAIRMLFIGNYSNVGSISKGLSALIINGGITIISFFRYMLYPVDVFGVDKYTVMNLNGYGVSIVYVVVAAAILIVVLLFIIYLFQKKIKILQLFNWDYLKNYFSISTFLLFWIFAYLSFLVIFGKFYDYYAYLATVPASVLISYYFFKQDKTFTNYFKKALIVIFVIYCVAASPIFASYINYNTSADAKEILVPELIDSIADIPDNASIYVIGTFGGVLGHGYASGLPPHSIAGLFALKCPTNNWEIIAVSQFVIADAEKLYSIDYSIEKKDGKITIELDGENVQFYKYLEFYKDPFPIRKNVYVSGDPYPYGQINNQTVIMENYADSDYLLICSVKDSNPQVSMISVEDIVNQ